VAQPPSAAEEIMPLSVSASPWKADTRLRSVAIAASLGVLLLCTGCATAAKYDHGYTYPFRAVAADVTMIGLSAVCYTPADPNPFDFLYSPLFTPLFILDLPVSVVTDLVTLPYDLYHIRDIGKARQEDWPP
jgi:uncharacterized protein YceK